MPTLILSDLHLGPGQDRTGQWSPTEDFFADQAFTALLDWYGRASCPPRGDTGDAGQAARRHHHNDTPDVDLGPASPHPQISQATRQVSPKSFNPQSPTTLVLAGDTFSLAETDDPESDLDIETEAAHRLHTIAAGHPTFFPALRRWLDSGNHIHFIPGNHDFELDYPRVQQTIQDLIYPPQTRHSPFANSPIRFAHFYHDPPLRLYVEHGDRYCLPRKPGFPPAGYLRDRYLMPAIKRSVPEITNLSRTYYLTQLLTANPMALLNVLPHLPAYLRARPAELPLGTSEQVTLHTINVNIITANWKRAQGQLRRAGVMGAASALLRLAALALPGAALSVLFLNRNVLGALGLTVLAALARILAAAATHQAEEIFGTNLPRAAAEDIAPAVERGGVKTLVFGHSHVVDRARFGRVDYFNTGTWIRAIDPFRLIPLPTQTYLHVDDEGTARMLQWGEHGPVEPILIRRD